MSVGHFFQILLLVSLALFIRGDPTLEQVKFQFNINYEAVTDLVPHIFEFFGGDDTSNHIEDGGNDMYDNFDDENGVGDDELLYFGGNFLSTDLTRYFSYTNGSIVES
jgi:hypothetical protein